MSGLVSKVFFLSLFLLSFSQSFAQLPPQSSIRDTIHDYLPGILGEVSAPSEIAGLKGTFVRLAGVGKFKTIQISAAKRLKVPAATKTSKTPITLKKEGKCYQFACADPKTCTLVWFDQNKDGKVQPRQELRCIDSSGAQCKMVVKQVKCK